MAVGLRPTRHIFLCNCKTNKCALLNVSNTFTPPDVGTQKIKFTLAAKIFTIPSAHLNESFYTC